MRQIAVQQLDSCIKYVAKFDAFISKFELKTVLPDGAFINPVLPARKGEYGNQRGVAQRRNKVDRPLDGGANRIYTAELAASCGFV